MPPFPATWMEPALQALLSVSTWLPPQPVAQSGAPQDWLLSSMPLRILLSVVAAALLFRVLAEDAPPESPRGRGLDRIRRAGFSLLGALIFFSLTANWFPEQRPTAQGGGFQSFATGVYEYRLSFTSLEMMPAGKEGTNLREAALADLKKAATQLGESAYMHRYYGIAVAHQGRYAEALKSLELATERLAGRAPERAEEERRLWRELFGREKPTRAEVDAAAPRIRSYRLGWIGDVAVLAARTRAEGKPPADLRRAVEDDARRYFVRLLTGALFSLVILPQLGLISLVVGIILIKNGVLRPAPRQLHPVSSILWESFIVMMALGMAPVFFTLGARRPAPETQPGSFALLLVVRDLAFVFAVVYLWWRLRGRGLTLSEVGLSRRHLGTNLLIGLMAATVMIPSAYIIGCVTQLLSDRFFPNIPPPYHPLQGLSATSGSGQVRWALAFAAVVGAPVFEEIFFRGALFGALRRRRGFWPGLVGSAAIFAILHPQLPLGFLPIAVLGATFAALYDWRQSLVPAMVAHAANNGMATLLLNLLFPATG